MRIRSALLGFLLLLLTSGSGPLPIFAPVFAQSNEKEKAQKDAEKRQELERKTLALLDETVAAAWGLRLPENRSFVFETAADLLWTHDEKRARNLFWEALNSLTPPPAPVGNDSTVKPAAAKGAQTLSQYFATFNLRQAFLRKVAQRDPQLALDMLRSTRLVPPENVNPAIRLPDERDLEQEIANAAVARDPKQALQIARESLGKGLTFQLLGVLYELNRWNPEAASEFASDVIAKIQTSNAATEVVTWRMSIALLRLARTPQNIPDENSAAPGPGRLKLTDDQKRELVETITSAALTASAGPDLVQGASEVMPEIEQFAPDRAATLKTKMAGIDRTLNRDQIGWRTYDALFASGTPEEMIKAAAKLNDQPRDMLYQQAVIKAVMRGKADVLRDYINNQVEDETRRKSLLDSLNTEEITNAAYQGKTEELRKLLPLIRLKEQRARAMAELAILLEKKGEHDEALKLLDDAQGLVKVDLTSNSQTDSLMTLLLAYALVDPPKAFSIIDPIIDRANDEISKLLLLDKIVKSGIVRNGEIALQQSGFISIDFALFKYGSGITALANADFNRTRAEADRFQRNELRIMARLLLAQALLRSNEQVPKNRS